MLISATVAAVLAFAGIAIGATASAAPGSPGVPQAPASAVYFEDFQNQAATNGVRIGQYTGGAAANTSTYVTNPNWAPAGDQCNGWILRSNTPRNATVTGVDSGCDATAWSFLQGMATAIGLYRGEPIAAAQQNQILSEYTNGGSNPGPGVEFQTAKPITGTIVPGHFYQISAIYGAANCVSEGPGLNRQDPSLSFNLIQNQVGSGPAPGTGSGTVTTLASGLNPCTDAAAQLITTAGHTYHVAKLHSAGFRMPAGVASLGIQLFNAAGSFRGNDSGFDDPQIVDATPQLDKDFSPTTLPAGQSTTLTFTITNTDELAAKNGWSFTDTLPAGLSFSGTPVTDCPAGIANVVGNQISGNGNLDAGTASCTFSVPVTSTVEGTFTNGPSNIGPLDGLLIPDDSTVVFTTPDAPSISLIKSSNLTSPAQYVLGAPVTYSFLVTNTGNVPLTAVTVTDTAFSGSGTPPVPSCPTTTLAVNASMTCTAPYTLTQADVDAGSVTNTAAAVGTPPSGLPVTDTSNALISGTAAPAIDLIKTADASGVQAPARTGDTISYTFTVTNTGNVSLQNVAITDQLPGLSTLSYSWPGTPGLLAPLESATATASYSVLQVDIDTGSVTNTALANGNTGGGTPVASDPKSTITPLTPGPELLLDKNATPAFGVPPTVGNLINFDFTITNTGNLTLNNVSIRDLLPGLSTITYVWPGPNGVLSPTQSVTATASYPIRQSDIDAGFVANTAIAHGFTVDGAETPSNEDDTNTPITSAPAIALSKTADSAGVQHPAGAGNPIVYHFIVTNTGNTTLTSVAIADQLAGLPPLNYTWPGADGVLAPSQFATATSTYPITSADIAAGSVTNSAIASGVTPDNSSIDSPPASTTTPLDVNASIALVKSASPSDSASYVLGQLVTYSFVVTNTGNVPLTNIAITEVTFSGSGPLGVASCPAGPLSPGNQTICTATYTLTQADIDAGELNNTASANGTPSNGPPVTSNESSTLIPGAPAPALSLVKAADRTKVTAVGQIINYTFAVTNTGNTTLTNPTVNETAFSGHGTAPTPTCPPIMGGLLPGATIKCTASYTVVSSDLAGEPIVNTATATATSAGGSDITSPPSTASVDTQAQIPAPPSPISPASGKSLAGTGFDLPPAAILIPFLLIAAGWAAQFRRRHLLSGRRR